MCVYTYICVYIYIYTYTHIWKERVHTCSHSDKLATVSDHAIPKYPYCLCDCLQIHAWVLLEIPVSNKVSFLLLVLLLKRFISSIVFLNFLFVCFIFKEILLVQFSAVVFLSVAVFKWFCWAHSCVLSLSA